MAHASNAGMINRRTACLLLLGYGAAADQLIADETHSEVKDDVPELRTSRQLIVVTTESWTLCWRVASIRAVGWSVAGGWDADAGECREEGHGWGIGLHGTFSEGGERKREGDKRAPAGVFSLDQLFGSATAESRDHEIQLSTDDDELCRRGRFGLHVLQSDRRFGAGEEGLEEC
jgi:hypothetical protein